MPPTRNIFGYDIWTHHILKVIENTKRLAPLFDADLEIVELAALLHDYASIKDKALYKDHHIHGPIEAEKLLKRFGYPNLEKREAVKDAIATHRASVRVEHRSAEGVCLANADAMSHIEQLSPDEFRELLHILVTQDIFARTRTTRCIA